MFLRQITVFASVGVLLALATGCTASASSSQQEEAVSSEAALLNPNNEGSFKLYDEGMSEPDSQCDLHTVLDLVHLSREGALRAHLHENLEGTCKLAIEPDAREYPLMLSSTECGSKIYTGTANTGAKRTITVIDHRDRYCRDIVPAQIIVEESAASVPVRTLLSSDPKPAAKAS